MTPFDACVSMTSRWFMPVSTTAHVLYSSSVFKEAGVFVMFAFLGRVSYTSWQVLPFIGWTHVATQRGACWRIEMNSLASYSPFLTFKKYRLDIIASGDSRILYYFMVNLTRIHRLKWTWRSIITYNNYSTSARWIWDDRQPTRRVEPSWL